jgi:hypothetical protein
MVHVRYTTTTPPRLDDIAYQATPDFNNLCRDFDLEPGLALDAQLMSLADSRRFWLEYDARKQMLTGVTAGEVATVVADFVRDHEPADPDQAAALRVIAFAGDAFTVQSADGARWDCTVAPSTE